MRSYDDIAKWYDEVVETGTFYREHVLPALLELAGDVSGHQLLDVACGQGLATRALARRAATVTGVDLSPRLLERARQREIEEPLGIDYREGDAETLHGLADGAFDGATCCMALMNINDLPACAAALRRVLRAHGWFVAVITHPCFQTPEARWVEREDGRHVREVSGYFEERFWQSDDPNSVRGRVGEHHRMLGTYVNTFSDAGFALVQMLEPRASGERAMQVPGNIEVPSILGMRFAVSNRPSFGNP